MPVVSNDRCLGIPSRKLWRLLIDVCGRPCDHAATFVSSTVEVPQIQFTARVRGHSCCATETGTQLPAVVGMAAVKGFSGFYRIFRALPG